MVVTAITSGIKVSVKSEYRADYSNYKINTWLFSYTVNIENQGNEPVQLLKRHWFIFDSIGVSREVVGEGVIGIQPVIEPGESHKYESACPLNSEMGKMHGTYLMQKVESGELFTVTIPEFEMITPHRLN